MITPNETYAWSFVTQIFRNVNQVSVFKLNFLNMMLK
jgi:hypothetical protein